MTNCIFPYLAFYRIITIIDPPILSANIPRGNGVLSKLCMSALFKLFKDKIVKAWGQNVI